MINILFIATINKQHSDYNFGKILQILMTALRGSLDHVIVRNLKFFVGCTT